MPSKRATPVFLPGVSLSQTDAYTLAKHLNVFWEIAQQAGFLPNSPPVDRVVIVLPNANPRRAN